MNGFLRSLVLRIARFTYVPFEPSTRKSGISGLLGNVPTDQLAGALSRRRMAEIDLKSLGIDKDPRWWETVLQAGMVFAAVFQAVCIGFAMFGSSETTVRPFSLS